MYHTKPTISMSLINVMKTDEYWFNFALNDSDLDFIYNLLLDREVPLTIEEMALAVIELHQKRLDEQAQAAIDADVPIYRPGDTYAVGARIQFPAANSRIGEVKELRSGNNPDLADFDVVRIQFDGDDMVEYAARLETHVLNQAALLSDEDTAEKTPLTIFKKHQKVITGALENSLTVAEDIVQIAGRWFPASLLAEIDEGHLNLAEAVLDVSSGGPLSTQAIIEHLDMLDGMDPLLAEFSLDYALQEDPRFDEVGPAGQTMWYLLRLEPPEVRFTPPRLELKDPTYSRELLTKSLLAIEANLDDEFSPVEETDIDSDGEVTISLLFPHWRVGTLPLSSRLKHLFPTAYEAPRIRFVLVDGHSGEKFSGWVVRAERYVFGLDDWYRKYEIPAGGLIMLKQGQNVGEIIITAVDQRPRNEWIRTLMINDRGQFGFTMLKQRVGASYDELSVIGILNHVSVDEAWFKGEMWKQPVNKIVVNIFRELAKLNPQSAVHAQALYTAANVIRRLTPGPILAELVRQPCFEHVGDLYWRFDEEVWRAGS